MLEKIWEMIYPRKCGFCKELIKEDYTCKKCKKNLEYSYNRYKIEMSKEYYFDVLLSSYKYTNIIRKSILEFKFKNKKYLYTTLAERLLEDLKPYVSQIDIVLSVPISFKRYFTRGYNQSYLIAKFIAKGLKKPLPKFVLFKIKDNSKQSELGKAERIQNVKGVYQLFYKKIIQNKNILLIDDIFTTGATINECSKLLKQNGAKQIIAATIAKAEWRGNV